mgnify:CR=1 FL=1
MKLYGDYRGKHKKGRYIVFFDDALGQVWGAVYSALRPAVQSMKNTLYIDQSLHDASGKLIAWVENGKLVQVHA